MLVMDSIVKIVLALKLKFLLIILSIGTSYFVEHSLKRQVEPVSVIEIIRQDSNLRGSGNIDARILFKVADHNIVSPQGSGDHARIQPVNYVTNRPFCFQGFEISIEL
jgi:hypothetical protein